MILSDLPEIQVTRNIRSTRLRLRVTPHSIKVSAPVFCTNHQIQKFIRDSEKWILETWQTQQVAHQQVDKTLPSELMLFNQEQKIQIEYITQKNNFSFDQASKILSISDRQPEKYLKSFVIHYGKTHLPIYLQQVSTEIGLPYQVCHIRQPKTRWGSCSARHDIMLNSGIVLFSKSIVRYLCVHELAHTKHFDHSANFWHLVECFDPNYKIHRKTLKNNPMPYWWNLDL